MPTARIVPVIDHKVRALCARPYPLHPKGCPNFRVKAGCPPAAPLFDRAFDLSEVWAVWNVFDLGAHVEMMRVKQPGWSDRQLFCCLYWQPRARGQLRDECARFEREHLGSGLQIVQCPEAMGVDITGTMRSIGIELEWPPRRLAYQVVLAARPVTYAGWEWVV